MRTFISRSFFKVCFNVNRENKNEIPNRIGANSSTFWSIVGTNCLILPHMS
jgi:hypothetical protein